MADPKALEACHPTAGTGRGIDMDAIRMRRAAVATCMLLVAAWLLHRLYAWTPAEALSGNSAATAPRTTPDLGTSVTPTPGGQAIASDPPPPERAPVARIFEALKQRADAGDAHAACRLAVDLVRCRSLPMMQAVASTPAEDGHDNETDFARKGNLAAANFFAEAKLRLLEAQERCKDVSKKQTAFAAKYLRQAARAGISDAIVRYADGQAFDTMAMFGMLRDPAFDAWRREAPELAMQALRQGNPKVVPILYAAYSSDAALCGGLIRDDPVQARAYLVLLTKLKNAPPPRAGSLTPAQLDAADALATWIYREDFHGRSLSGEQLASFEAATQTAFSAGTEDCR